MAKLHSIKFNVENPATLRTVEGPTKVLHKGGLQLVEFGLGWGPCGRWVGQLEYQIDLATLRIKQTSFSKDVTDFSLDHKELMARLITARHHASLSGRGPHRCAHVKAAEKALTDATKLHKEDCKVETFIYQLSDVRGRIHAVLKEVPL